MARQYLRQASMTVLRRHRRHPTLRLLLQVLLRRLGFKSERGHYTETACDLPLSTSFLLLSSSSIAFRRK